MRENRPSATAQKVAVRRASHQILDHPRVFDDPLALMIIGIENSTALQADPRKVNNTPDASFLRAFTVVRSRYVEDELGSAVRRGVRQYVILGAGLDTFAYRNPLPHAQLRILEVDHPATQDWKRARLEEAGISIPDSLAFVPMDFETGTLEDALGRADFDCGAPAFFSWLGVTPYLTKAAVVSTLHFIAGLKKGSAVVFDYVVSPSSANPRQRAAFDDISRRVAMAGEPWQTFLDPPSLRADLSAQGFSEVEDLGAEEINARYFQGRKDHLRVGGLGHLVRATV